MKITFRAHAVRRMFERAVSMDEVRAVLAAGETIAMLLLRYLQLLSRFGWSLSNLVALLRMNLFTHRDLQAWLDQPFATPPDPTEPPQQRALAFA